MKKIIILFLCFSFAQQVFAQNEQIFWSMSIKPNATVSTKDFEKKLATYYSTHFPSYSWRIYQIITGDRLGTYLILNGPFNYATLDNIPQSPKGKDQDDKDWEEIKKMASNISIMHGRREASLSNDKTSRKIKFISDTEVEYKIGAYAEIKKLYERIKKVRQIATPDYDWGFFQPINGDKTHVFHIIRYFEKFEELGKDLENSTFVSKYDEIYGKDSYLHDSNRYYSYLTGGKREIRVLREDLSYTAK